MRKTLYWMQAILLIALAHTRVNAAPKRDEISLTTGESIEQLPLTHRISSRFPRLFLPGIKPEAAAKRKNRKEIARSEANQPEADYAHERFNPNNPPPRESKLGARFARITEQAKGQLYEVIPREVPQAVGEVLSKNVQPRTDLVFVIDQTGSMDDDVKNIRREVKTELKKYEDIPEFRVGATTYSNVKTGGVDGFSLHELAPDASYLPSFLSNMKFLGGVEDMFGGVVKTIRIINWQSGSRRVLVVITDEPPETDPKETDYTEEQMLELVRQARVELSVILVG